MAENSKIEWTDATWNPVTGCSVVSPGCTNCYAMRLAGTRMKHHPSRAGLTVDSKAGPVWNGAVRLNEEWLDQPLRWKRPRNIFVCAHGDLFHENVPDEWIDRVFAVMALAPRHTFQVLTKRSGRMRDVLTRMQKALIATQAQLATGGKALVTEPTLVDDWPHMAGAVAHPSFDIRSFRCWPLPNVWLGVSAEDQRRADERIPDLLATPAAVRFVSLEPLLGPVDLRKIEPDGDSEVDALNAPLWQDEIENWRGSTDDWEEEFLEWYGLSAMPAPGPMYRPLDWVIVGGESGPGARPMHPDWARSLRDQCVTAGVAFFMKQMTKKAPIPDDLMIRQMPA